MTAGVPVVDVEPLRAGGDAGEAQMTKVLDAACRDPGFFYVVGHGVDEALQGRLEANARTFFSLDDTVKAEIGMARGGAAWRGWFPVGGELTSGRPDRKEGIYFGAELPLDDPRVREGRPLHGPNLFPAEPAGLRDAVLEYLDAMTELGHLLCRGLALALGLERDWFDDHLTADPTILFRIFHYPPDPQDGAAGGDDAPWGVGEHTDYGLLTILLQDSIGGLAVRTNRGWVDAPPLPGSFVCNLGDMLERMTGGRYRSTPHRVRNRSDVGRLSFPFFFDPGWDADVLPVPGLTSEAGVESGGTDRWDHASVFDFRGTYGDYLLAKVGKVFPGLRQQVLDS